MKQWQVRGEVLDSDDENGALSLGSGSSSPERPQKRARTTDSDHNSFTQTVFRQETDKDASGDRFTLHPRTDSKSSDTSGDLSTPTCETPPLTSRDGAYRAEQHSCSPSELSVVQKAPRSSIKTLQAVLIQPLDTIEGVDTRDEILIPQEYSPDVPDDTQRQDGDISDDSSVLSEREISPPPGFQFLNPATQAPRTESGSRRSELPYENIRRRTFRTRKEIQLHPYMLDRAEYLKQCRQRGMRPVRLQDQPRGIEESQDMSLDANSINESFSSPPRSPVNTTSTAPRIINQSLDYFDLASQHSDTTSTPHRLPKRRRIDSEINTTSALSQSEVFSLPPSPARTGSQLATPVESASRQASPRFRLPFGMTTVQLPTPQISSDIRHSGADDDSSSDSVPRRRLRVSTAAKSSKDAVEILSSSSSESSSSDEPGIDMRRLRREQRRIKGVLPASWLKLDFRKRHQQRLPSPLKPSHKEIDSTAQSSPRKGVAQRVQAQRLIQISPTDLMSLSEAIDGNERDSEPESIQSSSKFRLPKQQPGRSISARSPTVDDGMMENDWFDPMFAGSSRGTQIRKIRNPKQPRITEVFETTKRPEAKFSNERTSSRPRYSFNGGHSKGNKKKSRPHMPRGTSVRLSIVDAPTSATTNEAALPQFVKIALRHTRRQNNLGRHSPINKFIRMTTERDTEDALSVLRAWREGKLGPTRNGYSRNGETEDYQTRIPRLSVRRTPLAERSSNGTRPNYPSSSVLQSSRNRKLVSTAYPHTDSPTQVQIRPVQVNETANANTQSGSSSAQERESPNQAPYSKHQRLFPRAARVRGAQIETLASEFDHRHRATIFERRMQRLSEDAAKRFTQHKASELHVTRFLQNGRLQQEDDIVGVGADSNHIDQQRKNEVVEDHAQVVHRRRKHRASRIDTGTREYRQPDQPTPPSVNDQIQELHTSSSLQEEHGGPILKGLNVYGTKYSPNFDIRPMPVGVYFQGSTFIGSGEFHNALKQSARDFDKPGRPVQVEINGRYLDWGPWTEDIATSFDKIIEMISSSLHELNHQPDESVRRERCEQVSRTVVNTLRSVVRYCSNHLWFADQVDRRPCCESLRHLVVSLTDNINDLTTTDSIVLDVLIRIRQYCLVIALQALQLCDHRVVDVTVQKRIQKLVVHIAESLTRYTVTGGLRDLQTFYEDTQRSAIREAGVSDKRLGLTTIVLLHHTLSLPGVGRSFWQIANASFPNVASVPNNASVMEKLWYGIFTLLPALEFDSTGIAKTDSRLGQSIEDWSLIKSMLRQVLDLYENSSLVRGSTINTYVRCLLTRCHTLVNQWGWWRCEQLLGTIYDFFARRGLAFLNHEENHGSARFVEHLHEELIGDFSLDIDMEDRSFHIFLKTLATGLRGMQTHRVYDDRKIGGIAWRFIPSHGRTYGKDVELMRSDLDALRNHFDLLITLYFASPAGHRPRVELLRTLVDHNTSHREACRLSIRAWTNLAAFQASTQEAVDLLLPFIDWFNDILRSAAGQFRLARSEAEHDVEVAEEQGAPSIASAVVESTIAKNQHQIAGTLIDALTGLKHVLLSSSNIDNVVKLSVETSFTIVFELFDPTQRRLSSAVTEAIHVADAALNAQQRFYPSFESQHTSDDSQDFGDSSALQELVVSEARGSTVSQALHGPISQFVSNMLGADECAEDMLLQGLIDVWIRLIGINVDRGEASWISYIDDYSAHSWNRLRDTMQKRKFTSYFMARVINHAGHEQDVKQEILTVWLLGLVEREALLKYQHTLTSALLNHCSDDPLLRNLPFSGHNQHNFARLTLDDLRRHRLGLVSSVLSNMRENCEEALSKRFTGGQELRMAYAVMLRKMMQAMKSNYLDLQASYNSKVADGNVQGAYVEFVQHVVTFLQQHTTEICPIDRFFTDSTAFPLPATDPTYVIGRLRSYAPKLSEAKTRKQLVVFVQTVSERAATDAQQAYLVDQFTTAMKDGRERGDSRAPSLRHVLLTSIFPAYYDGLITNRCDWVLALPVLEASENALDDLLYNFDINDKQSVAACIHLVHVTIHCVNRQCTLLLFDHSIPWRSQTSRSVAKLLDVARACLVLVSYIRRSTESGGEVVSNLQQLYGYAAVLETRMDSIDQESSSLPTEDEVTGNWPDTRLFAADQVRSALDQNWSAVDDHYEVRRGNSRKEVMVHLEDFCSERERLARAIHLFSHAYDSAFDLRRRSRRQGARLEHLGLSSLIV